MLIHKSSGERNGSDNRRLGRCLGGWLAALFLLSGCETAPEKPEFAAPRSGVTKSKPDFVRGRANYEAAQSSGSLASTFSTRYPIGISFVPEMAYIPEVEGWSPCQEGEFTQVMPLVQREWQKVVPWVQQQVTPMLVRSLSRWSLPQMQAYLRVPPLATVMFEPVSVHRLDHKLVVEGSAGSLPTHSHLVTRWLTLFLVYDLDSRVIGQATITIRGEVQE